MNMEVEVVVIITGWIYQLWLQNKVRQCYEKFNCTRTEIMRVLRMTKRRTLLKAREED